MALELDQQAKLDSWLASKPGLRRCFACGEQSNWVAGDVVASPVMKPSGMHIGGQVTPVVQVICGNCAHVMLFAAEQMGINMKSKLCLNF